MEFDGILNILCMSPYVKISFVQTCINNGGNLDNIHERSLTQLYRNINMFITNSKRADIIIVGEYILNNSTNKQRILNIIHNCGSKQTIEWFSKFIFI